MNLISSPQTQSKEPNNNEENDENHRVVNNLSSDSDLGSTDEVKVFNDEDERDGDVSESCYQAELQAEKSSLIHESEQVHSCPTVPNKSNDQINVTANT